MADLQAATDDLAAVNEELLEVEIELHNILERQSQLQERKRKLLTRMNVYKERQSMGIKSMDWTKSNFKWSGQINELMRSVFKIDCLRSLQMETMNVTLSKEDCFLIMPTGGGKSLCFQLPALISTGITLVISPLVSLMEDQVMGLQSLNVQVASLTASSTREETKWVHNEMSSCNSTLKLLYVTPEKLAKNKRFMASLEKLHKLKRLARIAIDEVHCCSVWGHDFRPDYKFLGILKRQFPGVPILGLTATATPDVLDDVKKILQIENAVIFKSTLNRPNLFYEVLPKSSKKATCLLELANLIQTKFKGQSGIIYCFSRLESEQIAEGLCKAGVNALPYHAQQDADRRSFVHRQWKHDLIQVVVATTAFGMGIDKPNVKFVIHHSMSKSMENYYQESGRAGRDDQPASCIVLYSFADIFRLSSMVFTEQTGLEKLFEMVSYCIGASMCRRKLIAKYFAEKWATSDCNMKCDICSTNNGQETMERNVAADCLELLSILHKSSSKDTQVTALKLIDTWTTSKTKDSCSKDLSRNQREQIIAHLLLRNYLELKFHFTPYNTICYIQPGPRATQASSSGVALNMTLLHVGIGGKTEMKPESIEDVPNNKIGDWKHGMTSRHNVDTIQPIELSSDESEENFNLKATTLGNDNSAACSGTVKGDVRNKRRDYTDTNQTNKRYKL